MTALTAKMRECNIFMWRPSVPGRGMCGIEAGVCTYMLRYGLNVEDPTGGRYCDGVYFFENIREVCMALDEWDGIGDPGTDWVKHKCFWPDQYDMNGPKAINPGAYPFPEKF